MQLKGVRNACFIKMQLPDMASEAILGIPAAFVFLEGHRFPIVFSQI